MELPELYWIGIALWLAGFLLYLDGSYWRPSARVYRAGSFLCWIGFLATVIPYFYNESDFQIQWPTSVDPRQLTTENISSLVRIAWLIGFGLVVASWLDIVNKAVGWVGFAIGMTAVVVSWTDNPRIQATSVVVAVVMMLILAISARRRRRKVHIKRGSGKKRLGDAEHELSVLCLHDKQVVQRLIEHEQSRRPGLAREAAAAAAARRLMRDRR